MPSCLRLEEECRGLSELLLRGGCSSSGTLEPVEMPGQYLAGGEVRGEDKAGGEAGGGGGRDAGGRGK